MKNQCSQRLRIIAAVVAFGVTSACAWDLMAADGADGGSDTLVSTGADALPAAGKSVRRANYIKSTGAQYIDTGYIHKANTKAVFDVNISATQNTTISGLFGSMAADSYKNPGTWVFFSYFKGQATRLALPTLETAGAAFTYGQRTKATFSGSTATWHPLDNPEDVRTITSTKTLDDGVGTLFVFNYNTSTTAEGKSIQTKDNGRYCIATLYGLDLFEGETPVRQFVPAVSAEGVPGLLDVLDPAAPTFYPSVGDAPEGMTYGYTYEDNGDARLVFDGMIEAGETFGGKTTVEKAGSASLAAGGCTAYPALILSEGAFSLQDDAVRTHAVSGALTVKGGVTIGIDLTESGCDCLDATTAAFANATKENPVTIDVKVTGTIDYARNYPVLAGLALPDGPVDFIRITGDVPDVMIARVCEGRLVLSTTGDAVVTASWTNALGDNDPTKPGNWICRDSQEVVIPGVLPGAVTKVSLDFDSTWTSWPEFFTSDSMINLNGHNLTVPQLGDATITDANAAGYQLLDFIESTGSQYVKTGLNPGANTTIDITYSHFQAIHNATLFGNGHWGDKSCMYMFQDGVFRLYGSPVIEYPSDVHPAGGADLWRMTWGAGDVCTLYRNGTSVASGTCGRMTSADQELWLFKVNHTYGQFAKMRLYALKIGEGDTLQRNFVPARRNSDNKVGLLDLANPGANEFYENSGTGEFVAGAVTNALFHVGAAPGELHVTVDKGQSVAGGATLTGAVTLVKDGEGTFTWDGGTVAATCPILVTNGVFKLGMTTANVFGDGGAVIVKDGGQLDLGSNGGTVSMINRTFCIAGDGPDGRGAIVSDVAGMVGALRLKTVSMTDEATIGGPDRVDIRSTAGASLQYDTNGHFYQRGTGTVNYEGPLALAGKWFCVAGGVANLASNETGHVATDLRVDNATLNIADGAAVDLTQGVVGWIRIAHIEDGFTSGTASHLNVGAATLTLGSDAYTYVGEDAGSIGTMTLNGSTVNTGFLTVGRNGTGEVTQNGGTVSVLGTLNKVFENVVLAAETGSSGTYRLNSGTLTEGLNTFVGGKGTGVFEQNGGTATFGQGNEGWLSIGRYAGARGTFTQTGGTCFAGGQGRGCIVGEEGDGTLDVSGDGTLFSVPNEFRLASNAGSKGTVNVHDGGRLEAGFISHGHNGARGTASFTVDGGTIAYSGAGDAKDLFRPSEGPFIDVGPKGLTLDTKAAKITDEEIPVRNAEGPIVKTGSGALQLDRLPENAKMNVAEGTLAIGSATVNAGLVHRWSFNGDLTDSVGGQDATLVGSGPALTADGRQVRINPNGSSRANYVDLGANVLPKDGSPFTLEFWTTLHSSVKWMHIFCFGTGAQAGMMANFRTTDATGATSINCMEKNVNTATGALPAHGQEVHYSVVVIPDGANGATMKAYLRNAVTGAAIGSTTLYYADWNPTKLNLTSCFLGASANPTWKDADADASYNEVRVWKRAMSEAELSRSAALGPDRLIPFELDDGTTVAGAAVAVTATDQLAHRWSFNGDLVDSIGGQNATLVNGTAGAVALTADDKQVRINPNKSKRSNYIDLGANVLPKDREPITIELWTTLHSAENWMHMFCFSTGGQSGIMANFRDGTKPFPTSINNMDNNKNFATGSAAAPANTEFYYAVVIQPEGTSGTAVTAYMKDATTGATIGKNNYHYNNWNLYALDLKSCFLGASANPGWNDPDADASFNEVRIWKRSFSEDELANNVVLGPDTLPDVAEPADAGNVLPENPDATLVANNYLTHRWTFNHSLADVIGGQDATVTGAPTWSGTAVTLAGGNNGTSHVNLGANILPTTGPVTVEFWLSQNTSANWGYLFNVGSVQTDRLSFYGRSSEVAYESGICASHGGVTSGNYPLAFLPEKNLYHVAIVCVPSVGGGMDVTGYQQDPLTGRTLAKTTYHVSFTVADIVQTNGCLGRSPYSADKDPAATYDEVRIWNAALSEAQLTKNAQLGPDQLPRINPAYNQPVGGDVNVAAGTQLDLGGVALNVQSISGAGTVAHGTANVIGTLSPGGNGTVGTLTLDADTAVKGTLKLDHGDLLVCAGELDLRAATIDFAAANGRYTGVFATSTRDGGIRGPVAASNLPKGYRVAITADGRRAFIGGTGLFITIR